MAISTTTEPAPEGLDLKVGARVLIVKNDLENYLWVNGSLGTVTDLSEDQIWVHIDDTPEDEVEVPVAVWESIEYQYDPVTKRVEPVVIGSYTRNFHLVLGPSTRKLCIADNLIRRAFLEALKSD